MATNGNELDRAAARAGARQPVKLEQKSKHTSSSYSPTFRR